MQEGVWAWPMRRDGNISALGQVLGAEHPSAPCPRRAGRGSAVWPRRPACTGHAVSVCTETQRNMYIYMCAHMCIHVHMHTHSYACACTCINSHMHTLTRTCIHCRMPAHAHAPTYAYILTHTCAHTGTCVHNPQAAEDVAHTCEEEAAASQPLGAPLSVQDPAPWAGEASPRQRGPISQGGSHSHGLDGDLWASEVSRVYREKTVSVGGGRSPALDVLD